ncbi:hypothetical protein HDU93_006133 [Gonapodya sp. JEL0774]|nr:hypothetical protein HDU93_006133 [Gonapodya sp. JEL0774]
MHGGRRDWFQNLFEKASSKYFAHLNLDLDVVEYNPMLHEWPNLEQAVSTASRKGQNSVSPTSLATGVKWDGVLIPGNRLGAYDKEEWIVNLLAFMQMAWEATELPIVGVCFGHQVMAKVLGGEVTLNPLGLEDGITTIELSEDGRTVLGTEKTSYSICAAHQDAVVEMPKTSGVVNLGSTAICSYQGLHVPGRLLTVQNHPELSVEATIDVVSTHGMEPAAFEAWRLKQVELEPKGLDSVWMAGKLLGFILRGGKSVPTDVELEGGTA